MMMLFWMKLSQQKQNPKIYKLLKQMINKIVKTFQLKLSLLKIKLYLMLHNKQQKIK